MRIIGLLLVTSSVLLMLACGGNAGNGSTITSVSVTCTPSTVQSGGTSQCSATVLGTGDFSSLVTWTASAGTITSTGAYRAHGFNDHNSYGDGYVSPGHQQVWDGDRYGDADRAVEQRAAGNS